MLQRQSNDVKSSDVNGLFHLSLFSTDGKNTTT